MAPGAEFSLMHPPEFASLGDLSHISFLGKVVVTGSTDNVLYLYSGGAGGLFAIDIDLG